MSIFRRNCSRFFQQLQPINGLVTLFERNLKFVYEIILAVPILSFMDIRTDTCGRSQELIFYNTAIVNVVANVDNIDSKIQSLLR